MIGRITSIWNKYRGMALADRTALGAAASVITGVGMASVKLGMGVVTQSVLFIVSGVYYFMLCLSRFIIVNRHRTLRKLDDVMERVKREMTVYHRAGLFLCLVGLSYAMFSVTLLFVGTEHAYSDIVAITVATITVVKISMAARGVVISRREGNPMDAAIKYIAFTDALLSIVVMQNVLLVSQKSAEAGRSSGMFGIALGLGVVVAGLVMFFGRRASDSFEKKALEEIQSKNVH
jgi:divalent metal cation (Fe/Co/Zn/Cd) transporter